MKEIANVPNTLIAALAEPGCYPHAAGPIRVIETHISWVLLTGEYAYKIKKPINLGFVDFSTLAKRQFYCQEEIRLNRRLAKDWYLEVVPITGNVQHPMIGGTGNAIEYAVKMRQFPSPQTLADVAQSGQLKTAQIDQIADTIAHFHGQIDKARNQLTFGNSTDIQHWVDENFQHIRPLLHDVTSLNQLQHLEDWSRIEGGKSVTLMRQRKEAGMIRECHGDMHLGNMTLIDSNIVIFDCIEFNPQLRWIDVISEAAFLMMDLFHVGLPQFAYRFLNRYLQITGDYQALPLLRYYLVYRALVRAKVALIKHNQNKSISTNKILADFLAYLSLAEKQIASITLPKALIITHGFSGSGKSTAASQLAEKIGAIQIRSDIERKRLFGFSATADSGSNLGTGIYGQEASEKTYLHLAGLAKVILAAGFSVIVDAAFLQAQQRHQFRTLANTCQVQFIILDFQARKELLQARILQRQHDPSEATLAVLDQQMHTTNPLTDSEKQETIAINSENNEAIATLLGSLSFLLPSN